MRATQSKPGAAFLCETMLSQGETPKEIQPPKEQPRPRVRGHPNEERSLVTMLSLGETPIRNQIIGSQKPGSPETMLSQGETQVFHVSGRDKPKDGERSLVTMLSLGETPIRNQTIQKQKPFSSETMLSQGETRMNKVCGKKDKDETSLVTMLSLGETPKRNRILEKERHDSFETMLSRGETRMSQVTQHTHSQRKTDPKLTVLFQEETTTTQQKKGRCRLKGLTERRTIIQSQEPVKLTPMSKRKRRQALVAARARTRVWLEVLKAMWGVWTPSTPYCERLKKGINISNLPKLNPNETQLLLETMCEAKQDLCWGTDCDILVGVILVVEQDIFDIVWKNCGTFVENWLHGRDTRQAARRIELKERLQMQDFLQEALKSWEAREARRDHNDQMKRVQEEDSVVTHEMEAEIWCPESLSEEVNETPTIPQTGTKRREVPPVETTNNPKKKSKVTQLKAGECEDASMAFVKGDGREVDCQSPPITPLTEGPVLYETLNQDQSKQSKKTVESADGSMDEEMPVLSQQRRRSKKIVGDSSESDVEVLVPWTAINPPTSTVEQARADVLRKIIEQIDEPNGSLVMEGVHAFLKMKKLSAKVYEPWLWVRDDETAEVRAALWPHFRQVDAGTRDEVINSCFGKCGRKSTKRLFEEAQKKLKALPSETLPKKDSDSWLELITHYNLIGSSDTWVDQLTIVQQAINATSVNLHFESAIIKEGKPIKHLRVEANGHCWIATVLRQIESVHCKTRWTMEGEPANMEDHQKLNEEISKEKGHLKAAIQFDSSLVTSFTNDVVFVGRMPLKEKRTQYPVKEYSLQDGYVLYEQFTAVIPRGARALMKKGIPCEAAKSLWEVYKNEDEAIAQYHRNVSRENKEVS